MHGRTRIAIAMVATSWALPAHADNPRRQAPEADVVYAVPLGASPRRGGAAAKVTLVYACEWASPYCERIRPTFEQLRADYGDDLAIVHKHTVVHVQARPMSLAACAAHRQGKFWEMDALLWDRIWAGRDFSEAKVKALAGELGLDAARFERDYTRRCPKIVDAEHKEMARFGVSGVPASFVNGRFLSGAQPVDRFKELIDAELALASDRIKQPRQARGYYARWVIKTGKKQTPVQEVDGSLDKAIEDVRGGGVGVGGRGAPERTQPDPAAVYAVELGGAPSLGPASAKVTMVIAGEFGDPFCDKLRTIVDELVAKYGSDLRIVHKHFIVHPNRGTEPALAACAAHRQGKYAEMSAAMWSARDRSRAALRAVAGKLGLDTRRYDSDLDDCKQVVQADMTRLQELGVAAIPTAYINGRYIVGARPKADFEALIDEELGRAKTRLGKTGKAEDYYQEWVIRRGKNLP